MRHSGVRKQVRLAQPIAGRRLFLLLFLLLWSAPDRGQPALPLPPSLTPAQAQALVDRALANEIWALSNPRLMSFWLRKSSPRLTTTKKIIETRDGDVARLISINGKPLSAAAEQREQAHLNGLLSDPSRQMNRKQSEDADTARALKVLRALPTAFLYQYAGPGEGPAGEVEKFTFKPNPAFDPSDLELHVLTAMAGQVWIDPAAQRVVRLEGRLQHGVNFAWGILGHLNKGGSIRIEQADVGHHQWRIVRMRLAMTGRVLFFTKTYDTEEEESRFQPLPADLDYRQAVQMLRKDPRRRSVEGGASQRARRVRTAMRPHTSVQDRMAATAVPEVLYPESTLPRDIFLKKMPFEQTSTRHVNSGTALVKPG